MIYALWGFLFGLFVPYTARRFAKFMPATAAYALWRILTPGKRARGIRAHTHYKSFLWRSLMSGLLTAAVSYAFYVRFGSGHLAWYLAYVWILLLLAEIDWRMFLLPDILTVPLLILGFFSAAAGWGWITAAESAAGALAGYFLPVLVSLLLVWKDKNAFGGGDIKLLAATGAWLGVLPLLYVIAVSSVLLLAYSLWRRRRSAAYGPAIALSGIIIAFCFF